MEHFIFSTIASGADWRIVSWYSNPSAHQFLFDEKNIVHSFFLNELRPMSLPAFSIILSVKAAAIIACFSSHYQLLTMTSLKWSSSENWMRNDRHYQNELHWASLSDDEVQQRSKMPPNQLFPLNNYSKRNKTKNKFNYLICFFIFLQNSIIFNLPVLFL